MDFVFIVIDRSGRVENMEAYSTLEKAREMVELYKTDDPDNDSVIIAVPVDKWYRGK